MSSAVYGGALGVLGGPGAGVWAPVDALPRVEGRSLAARLSQ